MKRIMLFFLPLLLAAVLAGCGESKPESSTSQSQSAEPESSIAGGNLEAQHTLGEFFEIDPDRVTAFEHALIFQGPSTVESAALLTEEQAKDAAAQLSQMAVLVDDEMGGRTTAGGVTVRYTLTIDGQTEPIVIFYAGTFHKNLLKSPPVCYIDNDYYKEIVQLPDLPDIKIPSDAQVKTYDIVDGGRVERVV